MQWFDIYLCKMITIIKLVNKPITLHSYNLCVCWKFKKSTSLDSNIYYSIVNHVLPWWLSSKESVCNAGNMSSYSGSGRSPGGENGNLFWYSCLGNPTDRKAYSPCGCKTVGHNWWLNKIVNYSQHAIHIICRTFHLIGSLYPLTTFTYFLYPNPQSLPLATTNLLPVAVSFNLDCTCWELDQMHRENFISWTAQC